MTVLTVNPARAGMIPIPAERLSILLGKPRASGDDPPVGYRVANRLGVNPARAGMILPVAGPDCWAGGKPRASGDDPGCARPWGIRPS